MNKPVFFSIITVCRNEENGIRQTCESVCAQTFPDFEWIVIDGQSTDETLNILEEFKPQISCLVSESDAGIYDAMNKGILRASGEYLVFLNAGDWFAAPDVLEAAASAPAMDIKFGDVTVIDRNGILKEYCYPDLLPKDFLLKKTISHQTSFVKRTLFETHGLYDTSFKIAADYDLLVRLLYVHGVSYVHIPKVLANTPMGGISNHPDSKALNTLEKHRVRKKYFPWFVYGVKALEAEWKLRVRYKDVL